MAKQLAAKKDHVIPIILGTIIVLLVITILLQNRHINRLDKKLSTINPAEKKQSESNTEKIPSERIPDNISPEKDGSTEADNDCQDRVNKLESKIADMQEWQDYLEETMQKERSREAAVNDRLRKEINPVLSSQFESFFEENNLSANIEIELIELLIEKELGLRDLVTNSPNREDIQQKMEDINKHYDNLISNLLSEEEYTAYKEYVETEQDRSLIRDFKRSVLSGDNQLNGQQEKDLIEAIYSKRRVIEDTHGLRELKSQIDRPRKEDIRKILEAEKKLSNDYLEVAKDILTDSQMKEFKGYIDLRISQIEMAEKELSQMPENIDSDTERSD